MERQWCRSAELVRARLEQGAGAGIWFREALLAVPPAERDPWLDLVFDLKDLPEDAPDLPTGCVPYLPCAVDALLQTVERANIEASDVFVDVGSGVGRAAALVHLLSGASVLGLELQPQLVARARALAARLRGAQLSWVEGDAGELGFALGAGTVFFLYCPFGGARLSRLLAELEAIARQRAIRICCVDLPLPPCPWLKADAAGPHRALTIYRSAPSA